jgi:DNA-binding FadR family transcriptional regulator
MSSVQERAEIQGGALDVLGLEIVEGSVSAGYRYTIDGLQERFSMTRSSARDVMHQLETLGLVTPRRSVGVVVNPQELWNVGSARVIRWRLAGRRAVQQFSELCMLRAGVEPLAAVGAAKHAPQHVRQRLVELAAALGAGRSGGFPPELVELDTEFHMLLLRFSGNSFFASFAASVQETARLRGRHGLAPFLPTGELVRAHLDLAQAILDGDGEAAEAHAGLIAEGLRKAAGAAPAVSGALAAPHPARAHAAPRPASVRAV